MDETHMQHGIDWHGHDVAGWLASEKLDGVRAYWDGDTLWSRSGRPIPLPSHLRRQLPSCPLDGEIWAGYGRRGPALAAARGNWAPGVRFMVFDRPGLDLPWADRLAVAASLLRGDFCRAVDHVRVRDIVHLRELFAAIRARGGEGLMLMSPRITHYHRFRVGHLLKVKRFPGPWWAGFWNRLAA